MNKTSPFSLENKVIVITGATGVLGKHFSLAVAEAGAKVVVMGRNKERADAVVEQIKGVGGEAIAVLADAMDEDQVLLAKEQILQHFGTIDGLVNAAGGNIPGATISPDQNLFDAKIADTKKAVDLNLFGTVIPTFIFGRVIAEKGRGSIVNISSLSAHRPITRVLGYTMAKTAIEGFTKWMSVELAQRYGDGVRVNAISPGVFLTEQNRTLLTNADGSYTDRANRFVNGTPFGRLGNPEELKGTLVYLLSDASAFVSGTSILVDGGFNTYCGV
ncbi:MULTISPECIES: SDR family oxidoreductase [Olivibacter]|jgi:NAD(P)-dependent dehydrogenase (short-subunit alcohol dehydrogenase family)|uniref:3-oxoacyl-(Acyl-carrier-protein) reductase n=3 Tax=Sphingobacteriaceae TaxID=84566 RepID=F4C822_SPHS2|nr:MULTISPECIES: SDR family oxidoreductase [Olivibacter]MCL4640523.1 SDR family oxidoreductase [Olivibacter sp. UJ_SKK_5.1]MDM8172745.1 SDR family oxidoreductase [Olivibacter sp. 47]MDX3917055.1 SDR family oxidoreductase [Pseudosphingobacterium sp.]QEL04206.1 SDR family oxidoreductase [Olivibacter sp. LS-1]